MDDAGMQDALFCEAVSAIDAGDVATLERLLATHAGLVRDRLDSPGPWLRDKAGDALDGFFQRPYLLWFVAEDPVRNGKLPLNIASVARTILQAAKHEEIDSLQEQLDYALRLVCWSWIARDCGVQIELMGVLIDAGASVDGRSVYQGRFGTHSDSAIYNGNFAAAEYLLERGAPLTLSTALCLGRRVALLPPAPKSPNAATSGVSAGASHCGRSPEEGQAPPGTLPKGGGRCPRRLGRDRRELGDRETRATGLPPGEDRLLPRVRPWGLDGFLRPEGCLRIRRRATSIQGAVGHKAPRSFFFGAERFFSLYFEKKRR